MQSDGNVICDNVFIIVDVKDKEKIEGKLEFSNGKIISNNLKIKDSIYESSNNTPKYAMIDSTANYGDTIYGVGDLLTFSSEANYLKFNHVEIDGVTISNNNYSVSKGTYDSTIITFNKLYSLSLPTGNHIIKILSEDGYAEVTFEKTGKPRQTFKFYIDFTNFGKGVQEYEAAEGMTWAEWILTYSIGTSDNEIVWIEERTGDIYAGDLGNGYFVNGIASSNGYQEKYSNVITSQTYRIRGPI